MKKIMTALFSLCLAMSMAAPAFALEENINAPNEPNYSTPTSVDVIHTAENGAARNEDVSKNTALIPPGFSSPSAYALNTGEYLTPNLAPGARTATNAAIGGGVILYPGSADRLIAPAWTAPSDGNTVTVTGVQPCASETAYTNVTSDLYYNGGYLATLKIPAIGVNVKVYQGTDSDTLAKGAGHFEETSIWDGRIAIAGHNRGANCYFGQIHTLSIGDRITLTTKLGTRTYAVTGVSKISETDRGGLAPTADNTLSLYTCVRDQSGYRWWVQAVEVK